MIQWTNSPYKYILCISLLLNRDLYLLCSKSLAEKERTTQWEVNRGLICTIPVSPLSYLPLWHSIFLSLTVLNLALDSHWLLPWCTEQKWLKRKADTHKVAAGRAKKALMTWSIGLPVLWLVVWPGCTIQAETNFPSLSQNYKGPQLSIHIALSHANVQAQIPKAI